MVRTYAFNPSTQSAGLPGSRKPPPELEDLRYQQQIKSNNDYSDSDILNKISNFDSSLSSASTNDHQIPSTSNSTPYILPGTTQLFGVRSVLINGQQFYQPIDPQLNYLINKEFASLGLIENKKQSTSIPTDPIQSQRDNDGNYYQKTMAAFQMNNFNNHQHIQQPQQLPEQNPKIFQQSFQLPKSRLESIPEIFNTEQHKPFSELGRAIQRNSVGIPIKYNDYSFDSSNFDNNKDVNEKSMIDDLPWARGNPQPKSGKRGTLNWNASQRIAPVPSSLYTSDNPIIITGKLIDRATHQELHALPPPPSNIYQFVRSFLADSDLQSSYNSAPPLPVHLPSLNMKADANTYGSFYNDPLAMARSSYIPSNNQRYSSLNQFDPQKNEKEQHKYELLQQIEENKRRKELEKLREQQIEERERWRTEIFQQRQQAEIDAEKSAAKEKALAAERKALALQASMVQHQKYAGRSSRRSDSRENHRSKSERPPSVRGPTGKKLEWWEKKNPYDNQRGKSPVIPALRKKDDNRDHNDNHLESHREPTPVTEKPSSVSSRRSASHTPTSRKESPAQPRPGSRPIRPLRKPSIASQASEAFEPPQFDRADASLRRLSRTERELEDERRRVEDAVNSKRYDYMVFN